MSNSGKDSLLGNKIAAGVLTAGLVLWGANRIAQVLIPDEAPEKPAIQLAGLATAAPVAAAANALESVIPLLAGADIAKGQAFVQQQCAACHTLTQGGANGVGPNLYGVVGGPMFAHAGFTYSDAAKAKAKGNWNYDNMNAWLAAPSSFANGTGMSYAGIKNTQTRADVIAYLRTLAASPLPLPTPDEVKAATAAAAAPAASTPAAAAAPAAPAFSTLLASADIAKGQAVFQQQCSACHTIAKGGPNGVGPNLYGIVGAKSFSAAGFTYSSAVQAKAGQPWSPDSLSDWLKAPNSFASGTAMSFAGIKNDQTRADVIAYLNKNADSPAKLP
ncbi:cytochrome c family protein [Acidocella sp. KAb 2-4]|uniref:c-type cytochrome n=1 Tax=Acidocella sp. KAb 2-4 TaxID=2885158 RepID=UPI001D081FD4|nr:cytochrome c family protein [Acidocella sp. KAb 2-4]MCB5945888.1 cytochrome c family protein [Acidocella sp. KAb 2-4]